jgi:hypothetical protein
MRLLAETGGMKVFFVHAGDEVQIHYSQDATPLLDRNKSAQTFRGKRITSDYANPIASIPPIIAMKWLNEEGWWVYDPAAKDKLKAKLNDPEWRYLRTSELRV